MSLNKNIKIGDTVKGKKTKHGYGMHNGKRIFINTEKENVLKGFVVKHRRSRIFEICISEKGLRCALHNDSEVKELVRCKMLLTEKIREQRKPFLL
jgi:hypothetical protein